MLTGEARFFEVPPEDVDERTRRQATAWAERAAADLGLAGLGIRWFLAPARVRFVHPARKDLEIVSGPPSLAGLCRPQDPPGTIWLRADLEPTLAHQQLAHYLAHEAMHARSHALGRPWALEGEPDDEAERRCEGFAAEFCTRLRAGVRPREESTMSIATRVNGQLLPMPATPAEEAAHRQRTRDRLRALAGTSPERGTASAAFPHLKSVSGFVQAATLATTSAQLGHLLTAWTDALDGGDLTRTEADLCLRFIEAAQDRLEAAGAAPAQLKRPAYDVPGGDAHAPHQGEKYGPAGIEYSAPLGGLKVS